MSNAFVKLAYNDVMTGTLNKKALETYCAFVAEKLTPERVSVIIYDVDDFKSYNDHYSHMKGDEALKRVAGSVVRVLERSDRYLFRFGGEEFVVVLPDAAEDEACRIAGELLEAVRARPPFRGTICRTKASSPPPSASPAGASKELSDLSVITKADQQLYICKNGGKDCVATDDVIYRSGQAASSSAGTSPRAGVAPMI